MYKGGSTDLTDQLGDYTTLDNVLQMSEINPFISIVIGSFYIDVVEVEGQQIFLDSNEDGSNDAM